MADGTTNEPVLVALTVPARRSLVEGLVREAGVTTGAAPVVDVDVPDAELADFLAGVAHADGGFVARTDSGERAVAVVAATVAALCGEDIRAALAAPDIAFLTGLKPPAVEAARGVLLAVETESVADVTRALGILAPN
ncbi:hypothetical protein [Nocardia sp. XZ_19_385]|uniref:hypothetical protein n=1 Tax=Nocardia sp. XZ_19_385 TaxID=2769488 RepID=UPI001890050D|nr:hypothetical protein [Nocardia sp. XZ_19_385]